jgi:hypothetical protein
MGHIVWSNLKGNHNNEYTSRSNMDQNRACVVTYLARGYLVNSYWSSPAQNFFIWSQAALMWASCTVLRYCEQCRYLNVEAGGLQILKLGPLHLEAQPHKIPKCFSQYFRYLGAMETEFRKLYPSPSVIRVMKSWNIRWVGNIALIS